MEQYETWKEEASDLDMSVSQYIRNMTEAGRKKFDVDVQPDESHRELVEERNRLKEELERAQARIERLEDQTDVAERSAIIDFLAEEGTATRKEIINKLGVDLPTRVDNHLDAIPTVVADGEQYYLVEGEDEDE